jgi:hypothetical protein
VVFFYIASELLWQCCIFLHVFLHDFGTVLTVWYFSTWFRNCFDSVVFPTWFPNCFESVVFPTGFRNCSDSVVFPTWFLNCSDSVVFPTSFLNYSDSVDYTVRTVPKSCRNIPHCQNSSEIISKNTTLSAQFQNHVEKHVERNNTVKSVPKSCRNIPHWQNSSEIM